MEVGRSLPQLLEKVIPGDFTLQKIIAEKLG